MVEGQTVRPRHRRRARVRDQRRPRRDRVPRDRRGELPRRLQRPRRAVREPVGVRADPAVERVRGGSQPVVRPRRRVRPAVARVGRAPGAGRLDGARGPERVDGALRPARDHGQRRGGVPPGEGGEGRRDERARRRPGWVLLRRRRGELALRFSSRGDSERREGDAHRAAGREREYHRRADHAGGRDRVPFESARAVREHHGREVHDDDGGVSGFADGVGRGV
mmetsp:Transcript_7455/g.27259  ORF Transcript_7455/g.27259 Transcript_7455/m.27259 type:complete len:223 (+) Transcript_7455:336-1004(+)